MRGTENAYKLHRELGEIMTTNVTVRENYLLETDQKIQELMKRYEISIWKIHKLGVTKQYSSRVNYGIC